MKRVLQACVLFACGLLAACDFDLFDPFGGGSYEYDARMPDGYGSSGTKRWPVIFLLHGASGITTSTNPMTAYADAHEPFPFIVITPHTKYEWEADRLNNLYEEVVDKYRVDEGRVYATGYSMGAHGVFDWAADSPQRIAAAVMVAGAGRPGQGCDIKDVPSWFIHNRNDPVVPTSETERTVAELQACGAAVRVTINEFPPYRDTHNAWVPAFYSPQIYAWLLTHAR